MRYDNISSKIEVINCIILSINMSIPMSRAAMQGLKAQKEEELRIREEKVRLDRVKRIVDSIYNSAVQVAGTFGRT